MIISPSSLKKWNAGGILKFIALGTIRKLTIATPSLNEQQKIASCLSSLDELITAETEKIEQLQWHKKGLMQGLFP
ncbi:MAG: restriction endonuclease subunit S [Bacteroidales bacterium]|nr:restriction endonuclease subunit S [Bacteroidales bacterium]